MRALIVKEGTELVGKKCRHCPCLVRAGQSVLVAELPTTGYKERKFVVHTDCMADAVAKAPKGTPVRSKRSAEREFAAIAAHVAAGGSPFELV